MTILQVSSGDKAQGGAEGSALKLHGAFRQRGLDSWLAVGRKVRGDPYTLEIPNDRFRSGLVCLLRRLQNMLAAAGPTIPSRILGKLAWWSEPRRVYGRQMGVEDFHYPGTRQLLNLLPKLPSLVHCHNLHGGYFDLRELPRLSAQVPVILNLRDEWMMTGHCAFPIFCERWKTGCGKCPDLNIYPAVKRDATAYNWQRKKGIYARSHLYISAPSHWTMDRAHEVMFEDYEGVRSRVIPNAIDLSTFNPVARGLARRQLNLPLNADLVLMTAHTDFKDYATMKAALGQLRRNNSRELLFLCLGKDAPTAPLGQGTIRFLGFEWDQDRLAKYYQAANVFIHASYGESFGKAITEAMACGTPVVATKDGGVSEQVVDGLTGFLAKSKDPCALSNFVAEILADTNLQQRMGSAAAEHTRKHFGLERQVADFLAWYEEVIADWGVWRKATGSQ
jgi:glycosyltransferase involved in cell wall biosynthesis